MNLSAVFIAQGGPLEVQASVLASSLDRQSWDGLTLTAAVPSGPGFDPPSDATLRFLERLGVEVVEIRNPIDPSYPIANKLACLAVPVPHDVLLFLDSDMICLRSPKDTLLPDAADFAARLTDFADILPSDWDCMCDVLDVPRAELDHRSGITGEPIPRYFNSGCLAVREPSRLQEAWCDYARRLNDPVRFPFTRPFLDQISLHFALRELNCRVHYLDQSDHMTGPVFSIDAYEPPFLVHYHETVHVLGDAYVSDQVGMLASDYPGLEEILEGDPFLRLIPRLSAT